MVEYVCNGNSDALVVYASPPQPFCVYVYVCAYDDGCDVRVCGDI